MDDARRLRVMGPTDTVQCLIVAEARDRAGRGGETTYICGSGITVGNDMIDYDEEYGVFVRVGRPPEEQEHCHKHHDDVIEIIATWLSPDGELPTEYGGAVRSERSRVLHDVVRLLG